MMHLDTRAIGIRPAVILAAAAVVLMTAVPALSQDSPSTAPGAGTKEDPIRLEEGTPSVDDLVKLTDTYDNATPSKGSGPRDISEFADDETVDALIQWSSKYRLGRDLQAGDWVKYQSIAEPEKTLEIRLETDAEGGNWIIEKTTAEGATTELHLHVGGAKMDLLGGFRVDAAGNRTEFGTTDLRKIGEEVWNTREDVITSFPVVPDKVRVYACEGYEDVTVPAGTFSAKCLDVQEEDRQILALLSRQQRWISEGTKLYLCTDVPRLIPFSEVYLSALISPDDMMVVKGGLVKSHNYELVDYSGRQ